MSHQDKLNRLGQRVDKILDKKKTDRERQKILGERQKTIDDASQISIQAFWCKDCQLDFTARALKRVISYQLRAVYEVRCPQCQKMLERRITDKLSDPYWNQSRFVALQRQKERIAMLQPNETGFRTYYGDPYAKQNKEREERERKEYEAMHQVHKYFKD